MIQRYVALTQPQALGLGLNVFINISLKTQNKEALAEFEQRIAEHDEVMECYLMTGDSDYLIRVAVADIGAAVPCAAAPNDSARARALKPWRRKPKRPCDWKRRTSSRSPMSNPTLSRAIAVPSGECWSTG